MADPQQRLRRALDALDEAFVPAEDFVLGGCTYCYSEDDLAALSGPPEAVPEDLVTRPVVEHPSHWDGFEELLRRLTPRIARKLAHGELDSEGDLAASRYREGHWAEWPEGMSQSLRHFWATWWAATLDRHPAPMPAHEVLSVITVVTDSLQPWLDVWAATPTPAADRHLEELVDHWSVEDEMSDLELGFYGEYAATPELLPWVLEHAWTRVGERGVQQLWELSEHSSYLRPG